jgi:Domain of unknown function (DUF4412)
VARKRRPAAGRLSVLTAAAFLLSASVLAGDLTIVSKTRFGEKQGAQTVFLSAQRMKTSGGGNESIVEFESGTMTFLDDGKKSYYATSIQELDRYAAAREAQARESGYNAEEFGALREPSASKTGRARQIAGHPCDDWTIRMGDGLVFEVCAARDLPARAEYFDARGASYAGMGPMGRHFRRMFEAMKKTGGYPLLLAMHVRLASMKQESSTEATDVKAGAIPASTFEIPAGYVKKKSPFTPR